MVGGLKRKGIVMNASKSFNRGLKDEFVEALNREYEKDGGWWKKIVDDPELFIGIREDYLNIYFHGSSLLSWNTPVVIWSERRIISIFLRVRAGMS